MTLVELLQQAASESETPNTSIEGKAADLIERQAAQIEMMREALENIKWHRKPGGSPSKYAYEVEIMADKALSTTPDQALEQFSAKVRDQCIGVCYEVGPKEYPNKLITDGYVEAILAIKELP